MERYSDEAKIDAAKRTLDALLSQLLNGYYLAREDGVIVLHADANYPSNIKHPAFSLEFGPLEFKSTNDGKSACYEAPLLITVDGTTGVMLRGRDVIEANPKLRSPGEALDAVVQGRLRRHLSAISQAHDEHSEDELDGDRKFGQAILAQEEKFHLQFVFADERQGRLMVRILPSAANPEHA